MAKKKGLIRISVDVEEDVNDQLKTVAKRRTGRDKVGPMLRDIAVGLLEKNLSEIESIPTKSKRDNTDKALVVSDKPLTGQEAKYVDILLKILRSGDPDAIEAVIPNLNLFSKWVDKINGVLDRATKAEQLPGRSKHADYATGSDRQSRRATREKKRTDDKTGAAGR